MSEKAKRNQAPMSVEEIAKKHAAEMAIFFPEKTFFPPDIPEKKLSNAISKYASSVDPNRVLALHDDTMFGNSKEGFIITDAGFYLQAATGSPVSLSFSKIISVTLEKKKTEKEDKEGNPVYEKSATLELEGETIVIKRGVDIEPFVEFIQSIVEAKKSGLTKDTDGYIIIEDLPDNLKLNYLKSLIIFTYLDDQEIDSAEISELQVLMTQLNFTAELRHKVRELITGASDFNLQETLTQLTSEAPSGSEQALAISLIKDTIRIHNATKDTSSLESTAIQEMANLLEINKEQLEFIEEAYQNDKKILSGEISDEAMVANAKQLASKAGAVGVPIAAIYLSGSVAGLSAAGVTSGLASLGLGGILGLSSMVSGIGVAVILGVGVYKGLQWALGSKERDKASRREFMLQEVLRIHQKAISNLAEDVNYFASQLIDAISDVGKNSLRIEKLAKQLKMYGDVIKSLKANEARYEEGLKEETEKRAA